jgi:hypothetical protein
VSYICSAYNLHRFLVGRHQSSHLAFCQHHPIDHVHETTKVYQMVSQIYTCYFWQIYCTIFCATYIYLIKQEINLHCYLWLFDLHYGSCFQHDYLGDSQLLLDNTLSGSVHTNKFKTYQVCQQYTHAHQH